MKNRFAESYSGNVKNSEVVLRWAKDQSSNFILELVEDILEDISEEV